MVRAHEFHCKRQWRSSELVTHQHNKIRINRTRTRIRKRTGIGLGYESALSRLPDVYRLSESRADDAVTPNTNKVYCACSSWVEEKSYCAHSGHRSRTGQVVFIRPAWTTHVQKRTSEKSYCACSKVKSTLWRSGGLKTRVLRMLKSPSRSTESGHRSSRLHDWTGRWKRWRDRLDIIGTLL